jgi:phosphate transport system permease protein
MTDSRRFTSDEEHDDPSPAATGPGAASAQATLPGGGQTTAEEAPGRGPLGTEPDEPLNPLAPSDRLRRRQLVSRLLGATQTAAALLAVAVLGVVVFSVVSRAVGALSIGFLTNDLPAAGASGGGIAPAIIGTAVIVALATAIATPMGILIALYLTEFAGARSKPATRLALDLLNGLPTILVGLFVFGLLVVGHHQSGFAGALALAIIMLPLIARATQEVLLLVPSSLRDAADALGVSHWRTVVGVVLPTARGGILTATVLAVARAAGETAPLIFVCSIFANSVSVNPFGNLGLPNIPVYIFTASEAADPNGFARAWGAAFVLLAFILIANLGARALGRSMSNMPQ